MKNLLLLFTLCLSSFWALADGQSFGEAIEIEANGTYQFPAEDTVNYYKFTLSEKQVIEVSVNDSLSADLYYDNEGWADYSYEGLMKSYQEAGTYYLKVKNLLSEAFSFTIATRNANAGEYCDVALELKNTENINYSALPRDAQYYIYTAEADGQIQFSKLNGANTELYADCNMSGEPIKKWNYKNGFTLPVKAGQSYLFYMYHEVIQHFTWQFTESLEEGSSCGNAIELAHYGIVNSPVATGTRHFHFVAQEDAKVHINLLTDYNSGGESKNTELLEIYSDCSGDYAPGHSSLNGTVSMELTKDQEIFIKWNFDAEAVDFENFSFELVKEENVGGSCQTPELLAGAGEYTYNKDFEYHFYSFTPTKDCKLIFSDGDLMNYVKLKSDCNASQYMAQESIGELSYIAEKGIEYIIQWGDGYTLQENFTWTLSIEDLVAGETCANPQIISEAGEVTCQTESKKWFYSYTATMNGVLTISDGSSVFYNDVYCYVGCGNSDAYNKNGEITMLCEKGQTYIIEWEPDSSEEFSFTVSEGVGEAGQTPFNPIVIESFGAVDAPSEFNFPAGNDKVTYYSYKASENGKLILTDNAKYNKVAVGDSLYGNQGELELAVIKGNTYKIKWTSYAGSEKWYGHLEALEVGADAALPIVIDAPGDVTYPDGKEKVYYRYTSANGGVVNVTDEDATAYSNVYQERFLDAGEALNFNYTNSNATSFTFTLSERALKDGETQSKAIAVDSEGEQTMPADLEKAWFKYTVTKDGILSLSDGENSGYVYVYANDNPNFIARGLKGEVAFEVKTNDQLYIEWSTTDKWTLSIADAQQGETMSNPKVAIEGENTYFGVEKGLVWNYFSYKPASAQNVTLSGDPENFYVMEKASGDTLVWAQYDSAYFEAEANVEYLFAVQKGYGSKDGFTLKVASEANLKFLVRNAETGLDKAKVTVGTTEYTTAANGSLELMLAKGNYTYTVEKEGYQTQTGEITVGGFLQQITSVMKPVAAPTITVNFQALDGTDPLKSVYISVFGQILSVDADGKASIDLEAGTYQYSARNIEEKVVSGEFVVAENMGMVYIQFGDAVAEKFMIEFTVLNGDAKVSGAIVTVNELTVTTNEQGFAEVEVISGMYNYSVKAENYKEYTGSVTVNDADKGVVVQLEPLALSQEQAIELKCYPNPASSFFTVESKEAIEQLKVYDRSGQLIFDAQYQNKVDVSTWETGLYLLQVTTSKGSASYRIIVE